MRFVTSGVVQVFGRRNAEAIPALGQPASEKRQGTKSLCGAPTVQRALWGFGAGVSVGEADLKPSMRWLWLEALAWVVVRAGGPRVARQDLRCDIGAILRTGASGGAAGRQPATMARFGAVVDRR